jgi:hypothetical protein
MNWLMIVFQSLVYQFHYRIQYNHLNDWIILIIHFLDFVMNLLKTEKFDTDLLIDGIYYYYLYWMESNQIQKKKKQIIFNSFFCFYLQKICKLVYARYQVID